MIDPSYNKIPYVQQWNLNIQRELPGNIVLDVGYVANKGTRQKDQELARINQLPVSVLSQLRHHPEFYGASPADAAKYGIAYPYPGFSGTVASALRQYPQIRANNTITDYGAPLGFSTLQLPADHREQAVQQGSEYLCRLCLVEGHEQRRREHLFGMLGQRRTARLLQPEAGEGAGELQPAACFQSLCQLPAPLGRGQTLLSKAPKAVDAVIGGWAMAWILNYASGTPLGFIAPSPLATGWNGATNRDNIAAGEHA